MVSWSSDSSRIPVEEQIRDSLLRSMDANGATPTRFLDLLDEVTVEHPEGMQWGKLKGRNGQPFTRFTDFVLAERPEGLGLHSKNDLYKYLALRHKEEDGPLRRQVTVARMAAMRQRVEVLLGGEVRSELPNGGDRRSGEFQSGGTKLKANTREYVIARLKRDDPELAERVVQGELTPQAAAREKGWRAPRIMVTTPVRVAEKLRKYMSPEDLAELARLLT